MQTDTRHSLIALHLQQDTHSLNPLQQMGLQTLKGNLAVELTSFYSQHAWPWAGLQQKMEGKKERGESDRETLEQNKPLACLAWLLHF